MKIYQENDYSILVKADYKSDFFDYEVETSDGHFNMHQYVIQNRNTIFGEYVYLLHEVQLSSESSIDFIGFTESGAILLIEVKRGADTRNRQEVISQIGKYALDAYAMNNLINDMQQLESALTDTKLLNKKLDSTLLTRIKDNIQNNNLNLFLVTEDATDQVIASASYLSYGQKNRKISVIELKRYNLDGKAYCFVRHFNKQPMLNSSRKAKYSMEEKLDLIEDQRIRLEITRQTEKWLADGLFGEFSFQINARIFNFW